MNSWLRNKWGGLLIFLGIAALVLGGLGWVSAAVLRLESEQHQARLDAEHAEQLRLALWQLDGLILPELIREDGRPFDYFTSAVMQNLSPAKTRGSNKEKADWISFHFQCDTAGWRLHQLPFTTADRLAAAKKPKPLNQFDSKTEKLLAQLKSRWTFPELRRKVQADNSPTMVNDQLVVLANRFPNDQKQIKDYGKRLIIRNQVRQEQTQAPTPRPITIRVSRQLLPLWWSAADGLDQLVLVRKVEIGPRVLVQGVLVDLPRLQATMGEHIKDLFPRARFVPLKAKLPAHPERTMTALPIEIDPGHAVLGLPQLGWTPLRVGLAIAWAAVAVALLSVALGGWSLLEWNERKSRFVSAVTHELRTPLTTLRLYLDMLTGGMVEDPKQQREYLETLNAETERLHRLVGNVLDFSRLEKQSPGRKSQTIPVTGLLKRVNETWHTRCAGAGKELLIENALPQECLLKTDVDLVEQILGNLIDNSCKYGKDATDKRIWLRAKLNGNRLALEVEDFGPGIARSDRKAIFQPFRRGKNADATGGGVGLGLALARRWSSHIGGTLTLLSTGPGPGACFRLEILLEGKKESDQTI